MKGYTKNQNRIYLFDVTIFARRFDLRHFCYPIVHRNARLAWQEFKHRIPLSLEKCFDLVILKIYFNSCEVFDLKGNKINHLYKIQ